MKIILDKAEAVARKRTACGLAAMRSDCSIEYTDGIDIDRQLEQDLRARYLDMLDYAPRECLAVDEIEPDEIEETSGNGVKITLPPDCRRVFDLQLISWHRPVLIHDVSFYNLAMSWQGNTYRAANPLSPMAVLGPDNKIHAWPAGAVDSLRGIITPADNRYVLDESGLSMLLSDEPIKSPDNGKGNT